MVNFEGLLAESLTKNYSQEITPDQAKILASVFTQELRAEVEKGETIKVILTERELNDSDTKKD